MTSIRGTPKSADDRVSMRMLFFVSDLLQVHGADPQEVTADLPSFADRNVVPEVITWAEYVELIGRLGKLAGGADGIARAMRSTLKSSYSEMRALAGLFPGPVPFFVFVMERLMPTMSPGAYAEIEVLSETRVRVRTVIREELEPSLLFCQGTITLIELFPTHCGLDEARVEVLSLTERAVEVVADFPAGPNPLRWDERREARARIALETLSDRERQILAHAARGLHDKAIAFELGIADATVRVLVHRAAKKLGAQSRNDAVAIYALLQGARLQNP